MHKIKQEQKTGMSQLMEVRFIGWVDYYLN